MVSQSVLVGTASLYRNRAREDARYSFPSDVLDGVIRELGYVGGGKVSEVRNSDQFVVFRTRTSAGQSSLVRHPIDLIESAVNSGIEALRIGGLLDVAHTCVIAVSRGSLSGSFTYIYEVVRRCGWSVLPLGGSEDGRDISDLCKAYDVDTIFISARAIEPVFGSAVNHRFDGIKTVLFVEGLPLPTATEVLAVRYPHIELCPFLYMSNSTGPIALPSAGAGGNTYDGLDNVLLEVEASDGSVVLNGFGDVLVSVLGLEEPSLIRWRVGDCGTLRTSEKGDQVVDLVVRV